MTWAHLHVSLSLPGLLLLAIPVFSTIRAWIFLDQGVSLLQITGGVLVITALIVVTRDDASSTSKNNEIALDN